VVCSRNVSDVNGQGYRAYYHGTTIIPIVVVSGCCIVVVVVVQWDKVLCLSLWYKLDRGAGGVQNTVSVEK
jgi:hypothetical protein